MIYNAKNFHRQIEIGVKHRVLVSVQNMSPSSLSKSIVFLTVCVISAWLVASFRPQWFVVCLLLSLSPFYLLCPWSASFSKQAHLLYTAFMQHQFTVDISYLQKKNMH